MATEAQINAITGLYVAYFDRAPDPAGLQFWIDQLDNGREFSTISQDFANSAEAQAIYPFLSDENDLGDISSVSFITNIYTNLFGRLPDSEGLEFWTNVLDSGFLAPGDMVEAISLGARDDPEDTGFFDRTVLDNKIECARYFTEQASNIATFPQGDQAGEWAIGSAEYLAAVGAVGAASDDTMSAEDCRDFIDLSLSQFVPISTFNLMPATVVIPGEISVEITEEMVTETVLYWGNAAATNVEGDDIPATGIPVDVFFGPGGYFQTIASQDFAELDVIDTDVDQFSIIDWSSVTNLTLTTNSSTEEGDADATGGTLTLDYVDGSNDDVMLGEDYFNLLSDLMFEADGTSRFYEQEVAVGLPVYIDANGDFTTVPQAGQAPAGTIDRGLITTTTTQGEDTVIISDDPLVLTTTQNNMGVGFTSGDNDFIYAGQVELLHGATIDGGGGYNTLEIDAKGHFAQPRELTNIQQITIENLPNIYTSEAFDIRVQTTTTTQVGDGASVTTEDTVEIVSSPVSIQSDTVTTETSTNAAGETVTVTTTVTSSTVTGGDGGNNGEPVNNYPDVQEGDAFTDASGTVIDITRAVDLENLTVTEGDYVGLLTGQVTGGLNIVGVRSDATLTLQGEFSDPLTVQTSAGFDGDGFTVILQNVNATNDLLISQNSPKLNLVSEGGANYIQGLNTLTISGNSSSADEPVIASGVPVANVSELEISGDARLFIESDLASIFQSNTPGIIDASANTAGVDLTISDIEFLTFTGSTGDDRLAVNAFEQDTTGFSAIPTAGFGADFGIDSAVDISNTEGDNFYIVSAKEVTVTDGDGDNTVKVNVADANITLGDGDNQVGGGVTDLDLVMGDGDNLVEIGLGDPVNDFVIPFDEFNKEVDITAGNGENDISVVIQASDDENATVNITAGDGGNTIAVAQNAGSPTQSTITITTGEGSDVIAAEGSEINITSGGGDDDITIVGTDNDYASDSVDTEAGNPVLDADGMPMMDDDGNPVLEGDISAGGNVVTSNPFLDGVLLNIDTGAGSATITLGVEGEVLEAADDDDALVSTGIASSNVVAKDGSVITGSDITLVVNTYANLIAADVSGVTSVILDDDAGDRTDAAQANDLYNGERAQLTVTSDQFLAIGAENMGVEGAIFNTQGFVKIIVTETTSLTDLGVDNLPRNIDLYLEIADGVTVTMTAEQLHTRIARDGVTLTDDGNTDYANGNVVITGGGIDFDPFNTNDTVQTNINGQVYFGGSISTNDFSDGNGNYVNVTVQSVFGGYNRPADVQSEVVLTIDSDITPEVPGFDSFHTNVEIVGDGDITFTDAINLGLLQGESENLFTIDFSELGGQATGLTIGNFETVEQVVGNGVPGTEIFVEIAGDDEDGDDVTIGFDNDDDTSGDDADDRALISSGVEQYTVTVIGDNGGDQTATIRLCDMTEDLEVLAFRGNYNDTLTILDAAWGLVFDLEGGSTRKVDGPTGTSNVGTLDAHFEQSDAPAVINIFQADDADNRPLNVSGIILTGAGSLEVNADGPAANIEVLDIVGIESLDLNAAGDLSIVGEVVVPGEGDDDDTTVDTVIDVEAVSEIDASGVAGTFTATLDGKYVPAVEAVEADDSGTEEVDAAPAMFGGDFTFTGAEGGSELTLVAIDDDAAKGVTIDGGVGGAALTIAENATVDLDESTLINITSVTLENGSNFSISIADADAIGPDNFLIAHGDMATLNLSELGEDPFAIADYADGISVSVVSLIDQPVITLNAATDLTGIDALMVPEGTTLNLTAEQFQQLDGDGMIIGEDGTMNFTVNITDWTQASVDQNDPDGDAGPDEADPAGENFILDFITADTLTITMAEDISLDDNDSIGSADITMADGQTLTVTDIQTLDGTSVSGGTGTTIDILDSSFDSENTEDDPDDFIDASGFDVDTVRITGTLAANRNVDEILDGIPARATKEIINSIDFVDGVIQNVIIVEGTTVQGNLGFTPLASDVELQVFNLTLEGGTEIRGDIDLSQADSEAPFQQTDLQTVNIVSNGTAPNAITGETGNIITGNVVAGGNGAGSTADGDLGENDLLNVNISGDQALELGGIIFSSETGEAGSIGATNSGGSANDDDAATATLNIDSSASVTIGEINTADNDVDAVVINHTGDGDLTVGINQANIDDEEDNVDSITFNGSATGNDKISVEGIVDFSDDTLVNINEIEFDSNETDTTITLTQAQLADVGVANLTTTEDNDNDQEDNATLNLVEFGAAPFDATALDADIDLNMITMAAGDITLDPATNLTGVNEIKVPEGGSITLTAAQFMQLGEAGMITSLDGIDDDGGIANPITVNITDLTQADIDSGVFSLAGINTGTVEVDGEDTFGAVNLSLGGNVELNPEDVLTVGDGTMGEVDITLTDGQDLGLATFVQADGLNVTGTGTTDVFFRFDDDGDGGDSSLDASGYAVTNIHALNFFVSGLNIEELLNQLSEDVTLVVYQDPESLGILSAVNRVVILNEGVTIENGLSFNDLDEGTEIVSLNLTLSGGSTLGAGFQSASINLSTVEPADFTAPANFQLLTINSVGDGVFENLQSGGTTNIIAGDIYAGNQNVAGITGPFDAPDNGNFFIKENNLLEIVINADQALEIQGSILFNHQDDDDETTDPQTATLTVNGTADVTINDLDTGDGDVTGLTVTNAGDGDLTVGISNTGTVDATDVVTLNGSATGTDSVVVTGGRDFTNDTIDANWDAIVFNNDEDASNGVVTITVTQAQFDSLTAAGFQTAEGDDAATNNDAQLNLSEFTGAPFDATSLDADINMGTITLAAGDITLDPATNLTGVDSIIVQEGGSVTMTAAQFQQLAGTGTISGADHTSDFTVNITDLTQADIDPDLDGDGETDGTFELFDLSGIDSGAELNLALIESIELDMQSNLANAQVTMPDGTSLTLVKSSQADGLDVTGTGTTDVFFFFEDIETGEPDTIDASGYDVTNLHALNLFLGGNNIEELLNQLSSDVELIVYKSDEMPGFLSQTNRVVTIQEDVTVNNGLAFNDLERGTEVVTLNLTLEGGATLNGGIQLDTVAPEDGDEAANFQLLTINSEGDDTNVITGSIIATPTSPGPVAPDGQAVDGNGDPVVDGSGDPVGNQAVANNLLNIVINAEQALEMTNGSIVFSKVDQSGDGTENEDEVGGDDAAANVTVNGTADVTINDLDTGDGDVIALNVTNAGTGNLTVGISDDNTVDPADVVTLTGSATAIDTIVVTGFRDFSGDNIGPNWDVIELNNGEEEGDLDPEVTLTQAQFDGVTLTTTSGDDTSDDNSATLNLVEFGADPFDATAIDADIDMGTITMASGDITLDPTTDLTGVDAIFVPEGGTLTLTAAQYQQLEGDPDNGGAKIISIDTNDMGGAGQITVNITDLTQADVDIDRDGDAVEDESEDTLDLTDINLGADGDGVPGNLTLALIEDIVLDDDADLADAAVTMPDGTSLTLANSTQADGLDVTGGADTTVIFLFAAADEAQFQDQSVTQGNPNDPQIDASEYNITTLKALATFVGGYNTEFIIDDLPSSVELRLVADPVELGGNLENTTNRIIFVEEDVDVPSVNGQSLLLNDLDPTDELLNLNLILDGGVTIAGDISLPTTTDKGPGDPQFFDTLTIVSQGDEPNLIAGGIETFTAPGTAPDTVQNDLLNIVILAEQDLTIGDVAGSDSIRFNGRNETADALAEEVTANLSVSGAGNVEIKSLNTAEPGAVVTGVSPSITTLNITNDGPGVLTITGGTTAGGANDSIELGAFTSELTFSGDGDILLDTNGTVGNENGIGGLAFTDNGPIGLTTLDASAHSGVLSLGVIEGANAEEFTMTSGAGVTTATIGDVNSGRPLATALLDSTGGNADPLDDTPGWTFDFSDAEAGSQLTIADITIVPTSAISFDMGADAVLKIEQDLDLTNVDFSFTGVQAIELLDGVELTLTAAQADGLNIIRCEDDDDVTPAGTVNIIDLGDDPVDLSGIATEVAGTITLEDDDVTLDMATDLGFFTVALEVNALGEFDPNSGQTIRFTTEEQAGREITVIPGDVAPDGNTNSTNVIWLFDSITAPVPTFGDDPTTPNYDPNIGRVWISDALIASEGGDIENLFDSLTSSILRIDFGDVTELVVLNPSQSVNRIIEVVNNKTVGDLIEVDDDVAPFEEHLASLRIDMGGESTIGNITIGDVVADADTDPLTPEFTTLTFNSRTVLSDEHYLATEGFLNNNDGVVDTDPDSGQIESEQPDAANTVGDISVGGTNTGIELDDVTINTFEDPEPLTGALAGPGGTPAAVVGSVGETDDDAGAAFEFGTLTFAENSFADGGDGSATLLIDGDNDVTGKAIDASDADLTTVTINTTDHSGSYVLTGGSPAFFGGDSTETLQFIDTEAGGEVWLGHIFDETFDNNLDGDDNPLTDDGDPMTDDLGAFVINGDGTNPYAGIDAEALSLIYTEEHLGTVNLGVIAQVDGVTAFADGGGFTIDNADGGTGVGIVNACFGEALGDGGVLVSPVLTATGEVLIDGGTTAGVQTVFLEIKDLTVEAGGSLELIGTEVTITGDIDFTALAVEDLVLTNSVLMVAEGGRLTLTVEQVTGLQLLGIDITGSGTVVVTGTSDDTDGPTGPTEPGTATNFANLQTATVDLSAVTLADDDASDFVEITASGAIGDDGPMVHTTQTIIGSAENDLVTLDASDSLDTTLDVILNLGGDDGALGDPLNVTPADPIPTLPAPVNPDAAMFLGDVVLSNIPGGLFASDDSDIQIIAGEGFDAAVSVETLVSVQVAAGAEFGGIVEAGVDFVATAETTNDGVATLAVLPLFGTIGTMVDVSLAGGTEGWNLLGTGLGASVGDTLIGSEQDDVINGGGELQNAATDADTLTGNGGADVFEFSNITSTPVDPVFSDPNATPAVALAGDVDPVDQETITITPDTMNDVTPEEGLSINIGINGVVDIYNIVMAGVNVLDDNAVAVAVAAFLDADPQLNATAVTNTVEITGVDGASVSIVSIGGFGTVETLGGTLTDPTTGDVAEVSQIELGAGSTPEIGEVYEALITLAGGATIGAEYEVQDTGGMVAEAIGAVTVGLTAALNAAVLAAFPAPATPPLVITSDSTSLINIADNMSDDGGFALTASVNASVIATGASSFGASDLESADIITDFLSGTDSIDLNAAAGDGSGTNYASAAEVADFGTAAALAGVTIDDTVSYFVTRSIADDTGLLFFDADGNGSVDGVINLVGIDEDNFLATDIIA